MLIIKNSFFCTLGFKCIIDIFVFCTSLCICEWEIFVAYSKFNTTKWSLCLGKSNSYKAAYPRSLFFNTSFIKHPTHVEYFFYTI